MPSTWTERDIHAISMVVLRLLRAWLRAQASQGLADLRCLCNSTCATGVGIVLERDSEDLRAEDPMDLVEGTSQVKEHFQLGDLEGRALLVEPRSIGTDDGTHYTSLGVLRSIFRCVLAWTQQFLGMAHPSAHGYSWFACKRKGMVCAATKLCRKLLSCLPWNCSV